jgi:hypothetical protein
MTDRMSDFWRAPQLVEVALANFDSEGGVLEITRVF